MITLTDILTTTQPKEDHVRPWQWSHTSNTHACFNYPQSGHHCQGIRYPPSPYLEALSQDVETGLDAALTSDLLATRGAAYHCLVTSLWPSIKQLSLNQPHVSLLFWAKAFREGNENPRKTQRSRGRRKEVERDTWHL